MVGEGDHQSSWRHRGGGRGGGRLEVAFAWLDQGREREREKKERTHLVVVSLKFIGSPLAGCVGAFV